MNNVYANKPVSPAFTAHQTKTLKRQNKLEEEWARVRQKAEHFRLKLYNTQQKIMEKNRLAAEKRAKKHAAHVDRCAETVYDQQKKAASSTLKKCIRLQPHVRTSKKLDKSNLLGCTCEKFRRHIEKHFDEAMTWDTYNVLWHIVRVEDRALSELSSVSAKRKCLNYKNLRPARLYAETP